MALVDPNIAMSYKGIQLADPLAQYGQVANIQNALLQREATQFNFERAKEDYSLAKQLQQQLIAAGKSGDLNQLFDAMVASGNPEYVAKGIDYKQRLENVKRFEQTANRLFPGLMPATAPIAAPTPATATPSSGVTVTPLGESSLTRRPVTSDTGPGAIYTGTPIPENEMLPWRQAAKAGDAEAQQFVSAYDAAQAAPRNAMAAPQQQGGINISTASIDELRRAQMTIGASTDPRAKTLSSMIEKEIESRKQPDLVRQYEYAVKNGYKGSFTEFKQLNRAQQIVNLPPGPRKEQEKWAELLVKEYETIASRVEAGRKTLPALETNLAILDKGFDTGFGTEAKTAAAKILAALGVEKAADYAADSQIFLANTQQAVLNRQLEQKGPQTEADAQRITQTSAQLGNTKEANRFLLKVAKAQIKRDIAQKEFYRNWQTKKESLNGAEAAWEEGPGSKSLFDSADLKEYASGTPAGPTGRPSLDNIFKPKGR